MFREYRFSTLYMRKLLTKQWFINFHYSTQFGVLQHQIYILLKDVSNENCIITTFLIVVTSASIKVRSSHSMPNHPAYFTINLDFFYNLAFFYIALDIINYKVSDQLDYSKVLCKRIKVSPINQNLDTDIFIQKVCV